MMKKKTNRRGSALRGSGQLELKLPLGEDAKHSSIQVGGGTPKMSRNKTKKIKRKSTKSMAKAKPNVMEMFAKKLLGEMDFDVQTDLRMIRQKTLNAPQNNSVQDDDGPNELEFGDIPEAASLQYSAEEESEDSSESAISALSIHAREEGFELQLTGMKFDDLSFLTKFMTQSKQIKNIDIGETKI